MTDQEVKTRVNATLNSNGSLAFPNVFFQVFPELWYDAVKKAPIPNYSQSAAYLQTVPQTFAVLLDMWRNGEVKVKRFYDQRLMPYGEGSKRPDKITDYKRETWNNCWHLFCPVAHADVVNLVVSK